MLHATTRFQVGCTSRTLSLASTECVGIDQAPYSQRTRQLVRARFESHVSFLWLHIPARTILAPSAFHKTRPGQSFAIQWPAVVRTSPGQEAKEVQGGPQLRVPWVDSMLRLDLHTTSKVGAVVQLLTGHDPQHHSQSLWKKAAGRDHRVQVVRTGGGGISDSGLSLNSATSGRIRSSTSPLLLVTALNVGCCFICPKSL